MIELQPNNGHSPFKTWENPFDEGESPPPKLDTFRSLEEFVIRQLSESPNTIRDGFELALDHARAWSEGIDLLVNPIYRDSDIPSGDGSDVTLVPGYWGNEPAYFLPRENLRRTGWNANVYPPRYYFHIGPTESEVDSLVDYLKILKKQSGRKGHVITHSKGGHVALLAAITRTEEFTDCVDQLVLVGSPIPERVNIQVGTAYLITQALLKGNDFRLTVFADDEEALARLKGLRLTTLKIRNDPVMRGLDIGSEDEIFEVSSSHTGALHNRYNLSLIHSRLARPLSAEYQLPDNISPFFRAA